MFILLIIFHFHLSNRVKVEHFKLTFPIDITTHLSDSNDNIADFLGGHFPYLCSLLVTVSISARIY